VFFSFLGAGAHLELLLPPAVVSFELGQARLHPRNLLLSRPRARTVSGGAKGASGGAGVKPCRIAPPMTRSMAPSKGEGRAVAGGGGRRCLLRPRGRAAAAALLPRAARGRHAALALALTYERLQLRNLCAQRLHHLRALPRRRGGALALGGRALGAVAVAGS
jgi:hypothetical protein